MATATALFALYFLGKALLSLFKIIPWIGSKTYSGTVVERTQITDRTDRRGKVVGKTQYYDVLVDLDGSGRHFSHSAESKDETPVLTDGQTLPVLYNSKSNRFIGKKALLTAPLPYLGGFVVALLATILLIFISAKIS